MTPERGERLGCARRIGRFLSTLFGQPDTWWKHLLYSPRDLWWPYSESREVTMASLKRCGALIEDVGPDWLEEKDDLESMKRACDEVKSRMRRARQDAPPGTPHGGWRR